MVEKEGADVCRLGERSGVFGARVPEVGDAGELRGDKLRIVHEQIDACCKLERGLMEGAIAARARAEVGRAVVGEVGERRGAVGDAKAEGLAAAMGEFPGEDAKALESGRAFFEPLEGPSWTELARGDRKMRRREATRERLQWVGVGGGEQHADAMARRHSRAEEGKPVHVVPVQVRQEDRAAKSSAGELFAHLADPRAGVDDERGRPAVVRERHA